MPELLDGCLGPIAPMPEEHLPWVVLFARALDISDPDRRRRAAEELAAAYRALFGGD